MKNNISNSLCLSLLVLLLPAVAQAQYDYMTNNGTITITKYTGYDRVVIIPGTINGLPVAKIGPEAFWGYDGLTSVTIPDSVTNIENFAFASCTSLTNVTIGNSVIIIGREAFGDCTSLTSVTIPDSVIIIDILAFWHCASLTNILIGNSVTSIGIGAFGACTSLTNVTIGKGITTIGSYTFRDCASLTGVYFQGNAPRIGSFAFGGGNNATTYATVYYLAGTMGWGPTFGGRPTMLWSPQTQIGQAGFDRTNQFGFTITGYSGLVMVVEACTNLANPVWFPVGTNTLVDGSSNFSDPHWTNDVRIYRLRLRLP